MSITQATYRPGSPQATDGSTANKKLRPLKPFAKVKVELHSLTPLNGSVTARAICTEFNWCGLVGLSLPVPGTELVALEQSPSRCTVNSVFSEMMAPVEPQVVTVALPFSFLPSSRSYQVRATSSSVTGEPFSESTTFMFTVTD